MKHDSRRKHEEHGGQPASDTTNEYTTISCRALAYACAYVCVCACVRVCTYVRVRVHMNVGLSQYPEDKECQSFTIAGR